jgi:hypothetical protein
MLQERWANKMNKFFGFSLAALLWPMLIPHMLERPGVQNAGEKSTRPTASQNSEVAPNQGYTLYALGHGQAGDGTDLSIRVCMRSDGTKVTIAHGLFKSMAAAKTELERQLKQGGKVLERGPRTNSSGKVVGQRAIAQFPATDVLPDRAAVFFTEGRDYYGISSSSMVLAVDMARRYYNY